MAPALWNFLPAARRTSRASALTFGLPYACKTREVLRLFVMAITDRIICSYNVVACPLIAEATMRKALFLAILGTLLLAAMVEVVAAGVKTSAVRNHFYAAAPASGVAIAIPTSMKGFPTELLPQ